MSSPYIFKVNSSTAHMSVDNNEASNLPSLANSKNKYNNNRSMKKPKIKFYSVAKSDLDSVMSANITFCSFKQESSDISINTYLSRGILISNENIIKISKDFDPNRPNDFYSLFADKCQKCAFVIHNYDLLNKTDGKSSYNIKNLETYRDEHILDNLCKDKENKTILLSQLNSIFQYPLLVRKISSKEAQLVADLFAKNIFRQYPSITTFPLSILFDRAESFRDEAWDQISDIYFFFISFVKAIHIDTKILNQAITLSFTKNLFLCFNSPDDREREKVLEALYAIAYRLPEKCSIIFQLIRKELIESVYGESRQWGLSQILELLSIMMTSIPHFLISLRGNVITNDNSVIDVSHQNCKRTKNENELNLFSQSSNSEMILEQAFLSLHQLPSFPSFSSNLYKCIELYLKILNTEKSTNFLDQILRYFLSHYPFASQKKQIIFLNEIKQIISNFARSVQPDIAVKLMIFISQNLFNSPCIDVSEISLSFIFEEGFSIIINQYYSQIAPTFYINAHTASKSHHNDSIRGLAIAALQELSRINHKLFNTVVTQIRQENNQNLKSQNLEKKKQKKKEEVVINFNSNSNSGSNKESQTLSRQRIWEMIKDAAKMNLNSAEIENDIIVNPYDIDTYNDENGDGNILKLNKKETFDFYSRSKQSSQNVRLSNFQSLQNSSKIILKSASLNAKRKNAIDSTLKSVIRNGSEINCSKSISLKPGQLLKTQSDFESEAKMMKSQPLSPVIISRNKIPRSPRIRNQGIVKLSANLKKQPPRK